MPAAGRASAHGARSWRRCALRWPRRAMFRQAPGRRANACATCSQCQGTANIAYHSIEGAAEAIRAESCDGCHTYRKILYQEKDPNVEPVADDLASLALDLLMSEAGYHRGSGNPLLWQTPAERRAESLSST